MSAYRLVCLSVYQSPTGHNFKPIVLKLYEVVEVVSTEKPIGFAVKGHLEVKFLKSSFFIRLIWKLNRTCRVHHWIGKPTIFFIFFRSKGQLKVKLLKSSIFNWKIINLHPINLKVEQDLHSASLNWETNYFWDQKVKGQTSKSIFNWKNHHFTYY